MLYFILWAVFLLFVIVSVPVVNWIENKRRRESLPESAGEAPTDPEADEGFGQEAFDEQEPVEVGTEFGGDDFSAFDEEFK